MVSVWWTACEAVGVCQVTTWALSKRERVAEWAVEERVKAGDMASDE